MKKILLIEDVTSRQNSFMNELDFSLCDYKEILENTIDSKYTEMANDFKNGIFNLNAYSIIIVHNSAFENDTGNVLNGLKQYCEEHLKPLILFSGGEGNYYENSKHEYLVLNTKNFYSSNLKLFLEAYQHNNHNILMLSYGEKWELNILLNILEKINIFVNKFNYKDGDDILFNKFENFTEINKLKNIQNVFYTMEIEDGWIYLKEIFKIKESIQEYIQKTTNV